MKVGRLLFVALSFAVIVGCGGTTGSVLSSLNPFAGNYNGTVTFTNVSAPNNAQPISLTVGGTGHVTGSYIDPTNTPTDSTLSGNIDVNGTISGTTLTNATPGTFTLSITSNAGSQYNGTGTFTVNSVAEPVTFSVVKS